MPMQTIQQLQNELQSGRTTSVALTEQALAAIDAHRRDGPRSHPVAPRCGH